MEMKTFTYVCSVHFRILNLKKNFTIHTYDSYVKSVNLSFLSTKMIIIISIFVMVFLSKVWTIILRLEIER